MENLIINKSIVLNTDAATLWKVLTTPEYTQKYMFNCAVKSHWKPRCCIEWRGHYQGYDAYQKGTVVEIEPLHKLAYTTFDPNFGLPDVPENYLTVTYELKPVPEGIELLLSTSGFNGNQQRCEHTAAGWDQVINNLSKLF